MIKTTSVLAIVIPIGFACPSCNPHSLKSPLSFSFLFISFPFLSWEKECMKALKLGEGQQPFEYHKTALVSPSNNESMAVNKMEKKSRIVQCCQGWNFLFFIFIFFPFFSLWVILLLWTSMIRALINFLGSYHTKLCIKINDWNKL